MKLPFFGATAVCLAVLSMASTFAHQPFTYGAVAMEQGAPTPPAASPNRLNFGATTATTPLTVTPAQTVALTFDGGPVAWTASSNASWLEITGGSGIGSGSFTARVTTPPSGSASTTITIRVAGTDVLSVLVSINVRMFGAAPIGAFDTPASGTAVAGSIAVTGWALDDVAVDRVEIWRDRVAGETTPVYPGPGPGTGRIFIANAFFVTGARPDVAAAYRLNYPLADRTGWGYLLLTQGLWNQGNGPFTLYAFAYDLSGTSTTLGSKTITAANAAAMKPFGAIDTPGYGATVSGGIWNFGWALTPNATPTCKIGASGVQVSIDSGPLQSVNYGDARADIAAAFPGLSNTAGAGGAFFIDTTTLTNGTHQIGWYVTDDCARAEGIGSRFFTVQNGSGTAAEAVPYGAAAGHTAVAMPDSGTGGAGRAGARVVRIKQGERVEVPLPASGGTYAGYQAVNGERRPLPLGSSLDAEAGVFYWQPAAAFLGAHDLQFVASTGEAVRVRAIVGTSVQAAIDTPSDGSTLGSFTVAGWAIEEAATAGTGIDTVHVWAHPVSGAAPIFLGVAEYGDRRPDIGALFGEQFTGASFSLVVDQLAPGKYDIVVYPHSAVTGDFRGARVVRVTIR